MLVLPSESNYANMSDPASYCRTVPGVATRDHRLELPLDYSKPDGKKITVFAREVLDGRKFETRDDLPWIVFFNGGPGYENSRVDGQPFGWIKRLLQEYRILFLDQRGTGLSTPVTLSTHTHFESSAAFAEYLTHFRQTNIVQDAEQFRLQVAGGKKWGIAGQSFGGWCITTYLSFVPDSVAFALITAGLPPALRTIEEVYQATHKTAMRKNNRYYEMFPEDVAAVKEIVSYLSENKVILSNGDHLTPRRFQQLGFFFIGGLDTAFPSLHFIIERAWETAPDGKKYLTPYFLQAVHARINFETNPLYMLLHEAIYANGPGKSTNWAANRVRPNEFYPATNTARVNFTGETVHPWIFDDVAAFRPMKEAAEILASKSDWEPLYDLDQLRKNTVPIAAAVYYEDLAVTREFSVELAELMPNCKVWITNEYEHSGYRVDGDRIMSRLLAMVNNTEYFAW